MDSLFNRKIFRIPDYQRGYAWQEEQFRAFWEDLVNLQDGRSHYTGALTLRKIPEASVAMDSREYWLVQDYSYELFHVVDGQQRLTTFVIFVQALQEYFAKLPGNVEKSPTEVYVSDSLRLSDLHERYLFRTNPMGGFRTYMFGYTDDNPSHEYLRHRILGEGGGGNIHETFYTLNLGKAKEYFSKQLENLHQISGEAGLSDLFRKLTKKFLFNEYIIEDDFDVFVAFETMNNRGKKLSDLELLKNRLIYLTTLFGEHQIEAAGRRVLRDEINAAWKETYHQLGRNKTEPLNDDDFLKAIWIVCFKYSRNTGRDYARFLLDKHFSLRNVHEKLEIDVRLEAVTERRSDDVEEYLDDQDAGGEPEPVAANRDGKIGPDDVRKFVSSLKEFAPHWFASFYPELTDGMQEKLKASVSRLTRIGMGPFRPLVMVVLKNSCFNEEEKLEIFNRIERFIFLAFRVGTARSNYRNSEFYKAARDLDRGETTIRTIIGQLDDALSYAFNDDGSFRIDEFHGLLFKKFKEGSGYYGWSGLRYLLFEYEQFLHNQAHGGVRVTWNNLLRSDKDRISVEHVYPQTPREGEWPSFNGLSEEMQKRYNGTLGNLLLLSMSINASLQNDPFTAKKEQQLDAAGNMVRSGYLYGSRSEVKVAQNADWGPAEIRNRGTEILQFMETRWDFKLRDVDRVKLLFLDDVE